MIASANKNPTQNPASTDSLGGSRLRFVMEWPIIISLMNICIICIFLVSAVALDDYSHYTFEDYLQEFQKYYNPAQMPTRKQIFEQEMQIIKDAISRGIDLRVNKFVDLTPDERAALFNYLPRMENSTAQQRLLGASPTDPTIARPTKVDWRSLGYVSDSKDQQTCGSCWAFVVTSIYESLLALTSPNKILYDLAEQYLLECQTKSQGCHGGYIETATALVSKTGIPLQTSFPYKRNDTYYTSQSIPICSNQDHRKLSETPTLYTIKFATVDQIEQEIFMYGPVMGTFTSNDPSVAYAGPTGMIESCSSDSALTHIVVVYGYNETHWFVKNSWGIRWGNQGFAYVIKTNDCGISKSVYSFRTKISPQMEGQPSPTTPNGVIIRVGVNSGWGGYQFGIKQQGKIVRTIVEQTQPTIFIEVDSRYTLQLVMTKKGTNSSALANIYISLQKDRFLLYEFFNKGQSLVDPLFSYCPSASCQIELETYSLYKMDYWGDGWGDTSIAFGDAEVTGVGEFFNATSTITLNKNTINNIVVKKTDNNSEEIGFVITDSNNQIVAIRLAGTGLLVGDVLGSFCASCVKPSGNVSNTYTAIPTDLFRIKEVENSIDNQITLTVSMSDMMGDGWNGNEIGIIQKNKIVCTFGSEFADGFTKQVIVKINANLLSKIVFTSKGQYNQEIGFTINFSNGTKLYERAPGTPLLITNIFFSFCPSGNCLADTILNYQLTMLDVWGDGWKDTYQLKQDQQLTVLDGPAAPSKQRVEKIELNRNRNLTLLCWGSEEQGYVLRNDKGQIVSLKTPGTKYSNFSTTLCIDCINTQVAMVKLKATLLDKSRDGWEGAYIGLKSSTSGFVLPLGQNFTDGAKVQMDILVPQTALKVVYMSKGYYSEEIGFVFADALNNTLAEKIAGTPFSPYDILGEFCPTKQCRVNRKSRYFIEMCDSWGDGWNGTTLVFKQGNTMITIPDQQISFSKKITPLWFTKGQKVDLVVQKVGMQSEEIGIIIKNEYATIIAEMMPGKVLTEGTTLASFCPDCKQPISPMVSSTKGAAGSATSQDTTKASAFMIPTYILAGVSGLLLLIIIITGCILCRQKPNKQGQKYEEKRENTKERSKQKRTSKQKSAKKERSSESRAQIQNQ